MTHVTPRVARQVRAMLEEKAELEGRPYPDWPRRRMRPTPAPDVLSESREPAAEWQQPPMT